MQQRCRKWWKSPAIAILYNIAQIPESIGRKVHLTVPSHEGRHKQLDNENELVENLSKGDAHSLATLVDAYFSRVTAVAYYIAKSMDIAQDIAQEVFIRLWDNRIRIDLTRPLLPYLFIMARNIALDKLKHDRVRVRYAESQKRDTARSIVPSPEDQILSAQTLEQAMIKLSERRETALRLKIEQQLSYSEIAQILELTPSAAERLVQRAIQQLREALR